MILSSSLIGQRLSFDTLAPAILGTRRTSALFMGLLDAETARAFTDITARHIQVKPYISGLPATASSYLYAKFKYTDGTIEYLGVPWINADSIQVVDSTAAVVTVTSISQEDVDRLRQALLANGFESFKIDLQPLAAL